jgi:hypothetical protein
MPHCFNAGLLGERAGMSERQICDRTTAVFEYFNLPFDEKAPA